MNEKVRDFFGRNAGYIIVVLIVLIRILTSFIMVDETGKTISQIIADGVIALLLGVSINRILDLQGIMNGERKDEFIKTKQLHGEMVMKISPNIEKLDDWCEIENRKAYKIQRTKILARASLKYDDYFDENGVAKPFELDEEKMKNKTLRKVELKKLRTYNKAVNLKLTVLVGGELTSEGGKQQDPLYMGRTKEEYERTQTIGDIVSKIITACIFGYYGASFIHNVDYAALIWNILQIGLFLIFGVIKMYQSYFFVIDEFRGRIIKKIDNLQKFDNYINSLPKEDLQVKQIPQEESQVKEEEGNGLCETEV